MRVGSSKIAIFAYFPRYVFRTFTFNATIIITLIWSLYYGSPGTMVALGTRVAPGPMGAPGTLVLCGCINTRVRTASKSLALNGDFSFFRSLYLPNLHIYGHNYYIVLCSPLLALHWHRNGWPWMTLNGHFALKSGSSSTSNRLAFWLSEKTARKFAELRIDCQRQG